MKRILAVKLLIVSGVAALAIFTSGREAEAWGSWSSWQPQGTASYCNVSGAYYNAYSIVHTTASQTLWATNNGPWDAYYCGYDVQAQAQPAVNGNYFTVTNYGQNSVSGVASYNLTHSRCRRAWTIC